MSRYMRGLFSQIIQGGTKAINYNKIKRTISPIEAAQHYGTVKHGFMRCPFHADRTPSLKLYGDHFHCFGCGAHGDVIDLTTALLGCSESEAARRLEADFGSGAFVPPRGLVECKRELSAAGTHLRRRRRTTTLQTAMPKRVRSTRGQAICSTRARVNTRRGWSNRKPPV